MVVRIVSLIALLAGASCSLAAQSTMPVQGEVRADVIISPLTAVHAGAGLSVPLGTYVRAGFVVAAGTGSRGLDARTDAILRFQLDPFRQKRWAPYGGGGISVRYRGEEFEDTREYLLVFAGVEGPLFSRRWVPAVEVGLGGGTRIGLVLRQGVRGRR